MYGLHSVKGICAVHSYTTALAMCYISFCILCCVQGLDLAIANKDLVDQLLINSISTLTLTRRVNLVRASESSRYSWGKC
jgi:hypothetical protein